MKPKERFINACYNKEVDRPPVWMMRQAGRYLPEYRSIKEKHTTIKMMQTPELACEITLQPVSILGVDAAILYSDILMIPDAMGMGLSFAPGVGPVFDFEINNCDALNRLNIKALNQKMSFVFKTIELCVKKLPSDYPLLGFAGAPFTVACYMVGGGKSDLSKIKSFAWTQPNVYHELMELLVSSTIDYLKEQANSGVSAIQLFDTWAGMLSHKDYRELVLPYTKKVFEGLKDTYIPTIHYIKGGSYLVDDMAHIPSDVIGVDWRVDLKTIRDRVKNNYAIQGNFDPDLLMSTAEIIKSRVKQMISDIPNPKKGYIINLGHGIGQHVPVKNAKCFIDSAKDFFR